MLDLEFHVLLIAAAFVALLSVVRATTDPSSVQALEALYSSLGNPSHLSGWKSSGGDPCGESWIGISCSDSSVTAIQISGLSLDGSMGYLLNNLLSLRTLDISSNNIHDSIPYQLPPNLTYLNLANNDISGNLPYSISNMVTLNYLNLSHNSLSSSIGDVFTNLPHLSILDLSFNNFNGSLPNSFQSLSNLSTLCLQNNELTGKVDVIGNLSLTNLDIANNHFTGSIPLKFKSITYLVTEGNSFENDSVIPSPPRKSQFDHNNGDSLTSAPVVADQSSPHNRLNNEKHLEATRVIVVITAGSVLIGIVVYVTTVLCLRRKSKSTVIEEIETRAAMNSISDTAINKEAHEQRIKTLSPVLSLHSADKSIGEWVNVKNGYLKRQKVPISVRVYTVSYLQAATNNFSQEYLIGEGSLGRVYKVEMPNGKALAVKKIDSAALSLQEEDIFLETVSSISRLRHPNITLLQGYCAEHGQRLLVYEYAGNGTLHDLLHLTGRSGKILTWNARVRIALGIARALEYLHEVCLPPVVHRNLKSANILVDEERIPYVSDCGLASLTPNTEKHVSSHIIGSFGYSAPEFAMSGIYTAKCDVYSFGVVMLELMTGQKPLDGSRVRSEQSLVRWAAPQLHDIDALAKMVDPVLNGIYPAKSLSQFADIIALCVQPEPEFRPPMSEVVQALVRLMQRANIIKRPTSDEPGLSYKLPDHEAADFRH